MCLASSTRAVQVWWTAVVVCCVSDSLVWSKLEKIEQILDCWLADGLPRIVHFYLTDLRSLDVCDVPHLSDDLKELCGVKGKNLRDGQAKDCPESDLLDEAEIGVD